MNVDRYDEWLQLRQFHSPVKPLNVLIDSGSDISLCWNFDLFRFVEPCDFKTCTRVGNTPLKVNGVGLIRFCLGSYGDHLGQRHPLDMEIQNVHYVPERSINILSTTYIKRYSMFLKTEFTTNMLLVLGQPSQVIGIWGDWHQTQGYPAVYVTLGHNKPVIRTFPFDSATWTSVALPLIKCVSHVRGTM